MTNLKIIYWQLPNGYIGKGNPIPNELALVWLKHLKKQDITIKYWINYSKLLNIPKFTNSLTFSDTKIYYPNLLENATFYAYYLLNHKNTKTRWLLLLVYKNSFLAFSTKTIFWGNAF